MRPDERPPRARGLESALIAWVLAVFGLYVWQFRDIAGKVIDLVLAR